MAAGNPLVGADPALSVDATDGGGGVTSIKLLVDGQQADTLTQDCDAGGCQLQGALMPNLTDQASGQHSYDIVGTDSAGNAADNSGTFRLDRTPPVLAITADLADSDGGPLAARGGEIYYDFGNAGACSAPLASNWDQQLPNHWGSVTSPRRLLRRHVVAASGDLPAVQR